MKTMPYFQGTGSRKTSVARVRLVPGEGTVVDHALIDDVFGQFMPTHVVHAAAAYKDPNDWREDARTNIEGTINDSGIVQAVKIYVDGVTQYSFNGTTKYVQTSIPMSRGSHRLTVKVWDQLGAFSSSVNVSVQ